MHAIKLMMTTADTVPAIAGSEVEVDDESGCITIRIILIKYSTCVCTCKANHNYIG